MTNFEKYKDKILNLAETMFSDHPNPIAFAILYFCGKNYLVEAVEWLFDEYKPKLLENAKDLNVGDWLMIRDDEKTGWAKRQFICYYDGLFWCLAEKENMDDESVTIFGWKQARRLEEGE